MWFDQYLVILISSLGKVQPRAIVMMIMISLTGIILFGLLVLGWFTYLLPRMRLKMGRVCNAMIYYVMTIVFIGIFHIWLWWWWWWRPSGWGKLILYFNKIVIDKSFYNYSEKIIIMQNTNDWHRNCHTICGLPNNDYRTDWFVLCARQLKLLWRIIPLIKE